MGEREQQLDKEGLASKFAYARNLFVHLFRNEMSLVNLGYSPSQKTLAKVALLYLEQDEGELCFDLETHPLVFFGDEGWLVGVLLTKTNRESYRASAFYDVLGLSLGRLSTQEEQFRASLFWKPKTICFERDYPLVAEINMIPEDASIDDIDSLVKHLYEERYGGEVNMEEASLISVVKTRIIPSVATYRAAWTDDKTKLELVVESNYTSKVMGGELVNELYVWRKLPTQDFQGQKWIPFGRKPNISTKKMKKVLEAKKEGMTTGQFVYT